MANFGAGDLTERRMAEVADPPHRERQRCLALDQRPDAAAPALAVTRPDEALEDPGGVRTTSGELLPLAVAEDLDRHPAAQRIRRLRPKLQPFALADRDKGEAEGGQDLLRLLGG